MTFLATQPALLERAGPGQGTMEQDGALDPVTTLSAETRDRFVAENMRRIFRQMYRMVGNIEDAQDLTQEAFIKALQRQDQIREGEKATHWLSRIATNTALDFLRRHNRVSFVDMAEVYGENYASHGPSPEGMAIRNQERDWLNSGLDRLTSRERAAIVLRDVEELPAEEVAAHLGCSKATIRSHIANARTKLRKFAGSPERRHP
jgi:RNA polymerase sigma-70 factor (ECF subfamily)